MLAAMLSVLLIATVRAAQLTVNPQPPTLLRTPSIITTASNKMTQPPITPEEIERITNQARSNPKSLVPHIQAQLNKFKDDIQMEMGPNFYYSTNEGRGAWVEAIQFLNNQKSLPPMSLHSGLCKAAAVHAVDLANNNLMGHTGSDGSSMQQRIKRYCNYTSGKIGENIAQQFTYKGRDHALESIIGLIIDDGVSSRGHRKAIFSEDYRYFGSASTRSPDYILTVIDYASVNIPERTGTKAPQSTSQYNNKADTDLPGSTGGRGGSGGGWSGSWSSSGGGMPPGFSGYDDFGGFSGMHTGGIGGFNQGFGTQGFGTQGFGTQGFGTQGFGTQAFGVGNGWNMVPSSKSQPQKNSGGGRYVVSSNSSTQTRTVNGVRTTKTVITKIYNDGSKEVEENEETSS